MRIDPKICTNAVILVTALFASISLADQPETDATSKPKPGELRSFEIAPTIKMQFCWIPPGVEQLGSSEAEQKAAIDSIFGHTPALESTEKRETRGVFQSKGFWFAKYPVTQEEWQAVMSDNPSDYKPAHAGIDNGKMPVESVSWLDCHRFLVQMNQRSGKKDLFGRRGEFVLPDENEWEYACRGGLGSLRVFYFGNTLNGRQANCWGDYPFGFGKDAVVKNGPSLLHPSIVGHYERVAPHPWGLCDMHGNVRQWCENWVDAKQQYRVSRGGSYAQPAARCRSASRWGARETDKSSETGFRVCFRPE